MNRIRHRSGHCRVFTWRSRLAVKTTKTNMGCVSRLFCKFWKNEKHVRNFFGIFWLVLILWMGIYMLWYAEKKYSAVPGTAVRQTKTAERTGRQEEVPDTRGNDDCYDSIPMEDEKDNNY